MGTPSALLTKPQAGVRLRAPRGGHAARGFRRSTQMSKKFLGIGLGIVLAGLALFVWSRSTGAQSPEMPKFKVDATWPKPLPNKWKMGGVTGLAVDKDDNVWVYDRPNDLRDMELKAELQPHIADCCTRPPSMIHIDKAGNVIGSFDPPQGHGMAVDSKGFVYLGNAVKGMNTVRKYDPKTGQMLKEVPRIPETQGGGGD